MANRKNTFLLKRSNVVSKVPSLGDIQLGEIALNTADAKLFSTYTGGLTGATEIREIGWDRVKDGVNNGGANEVFSGKSGTDLYFRTISGGTNTTVTTIGDIIKIDSTGGSGDNFYVTGFTYNDANTFTISRNDGVDLSASINTMTGLTINGTLVVDILSATTFTGLTLNDLDDVTSNIPTTPDNTYQGRLLYFDVTDNQWVTGEEYVSTGNVTIWAKKGSAGTIVKGLPVYIVGFDNDIHEVELANATTASTMPVIGFTGEDFDNAGVYPLITFGKLVGVDTTSTVSTINPNGETWAVNDVLYMAKSDGGLTKFRPSGTHTQIQRIAKVLRVATTSGQLFIFNTARTAGLPNLTTDYLWLGNGNDTPQEVIRTDVGITTTGFTYNDNNTFTITDNNGGSLSTTINQVSGLTINGNLDVTGDIGNTGNCVTNLYVSNIQSCSPLNINSNDEGNVYFGSTSGVTIDVINSKLGIGTTTPTGDLDISNGTDSFIVDLDGAVGPYINVVSTDTTKRCILAAVNDTTSLSFGQIGITNTGSTGYGSPGDGYIYSSAASNGLNIISQPGTGTEDYIRFYAGGNAQTSTASIHINGSGSTKGYVGIGTENPEKPVHIYSNNSAPMRVESTSTNSTVQFKDTNTTNLPFIGSNGDSFQIGHITGGETLTVTETGNVGIGTDLPADTLTVLGSFNLREYGTITGPTSTAGWYRLGYTSAGDRGGIRVVISYIGYSWTPVTYVINAFKNWTDVSSLSLEKYGSVNYITEARIVEDEIDSTTYHLEVYLTSWGVGHSARVYFDKNLGYEGTWNLNTGSLSASTSTATPVARSPFTSNDGGYTLENLIINDNVNNQFWKFEDTSGSLEIKDWNSDNLITFDGVNNRVGIGTTAPSHRLSISGSSGLIETRVDKTLPYTSEIYGKTTNASGSSVIQLVNDSVSSIVMGVLGTNRDASVAYGGESDDAFLFASTAANNLNIFNGAGTGTEDSINFYAGNNATATPHVHIHGSGSTKGYVGIGTNTPSEKLEVSGNTIISGTLTATSITSNSAINVFNGHINLRDNSYFLQGRTVADANVSLIGVDNQDRVFVGNAGYDTFIDSDTIVDGSLTATTLNITTIGGTTSVANLGIDSSGNVVSGNTGSGIYGGDGVVPLDTTVSVNGDLTFQGLDEDTRLIVKDGNNGGEVHLFSDGSAGQSALEFYNPGGVTLTSKIQNAGGDTRFISNNRDLLFTTNTGVTTEGIFIQAGTGNMGIGTETPQAELHVKGDSSILRLETTSATNNNYVEFWDPTERKGFLGYVSTANIDALFIRNEEHDADIIISTTDSGGTSRTAINIDGNQDVGIPNGNLDVSGTLNIGTIGGGTPVGNLGFDSNGQVVTGTTAGGDSNSTVENFYYSISNSVDTRPIFEDTNVLFNWDETGNDLEFQMKVAPGGSGDMRSLAYLVGGSTQNTFIVSTGVNYDVYTAGVSAGNRLEVFITAENDVTYPAYHVIVYNTGESVENTVWIQRITRN
jgi:hypothetical protein